MPHGTTTTAGSPTARGRAAARLLRSVVLLFGLAAVLAAAGPAAAAQHPYTQGCKALSAGDVAKATQLFKAAVKLNPQDTDALNNLAVCYMKSGDYTKALPLLEKVLRLNKRYAGADLNIGADRLFQDEPAKAEPPTRRALKAPGTANGKTVKAAAYYNLGLVEAQKGLYAEAQTDLERAAELAPSPKAEIALAGVLAAQGLYDDALATLEAVVEDVGDGQLADTLRTNLAALYYQRGMARLEDGDVAGAKADFAASNEQVANDYAAMGLALVDAKEGRKDAAVAALKDLSASASPAALAEAATDNLATVTEEPKGEEPGAGTDEGSTTSSLDWLIIIGGGVLFALQTYAVMRAAAYKGGRAQVMVAVGGLAGVATAAVFALAFFDVFDSSVLVLAAFAVDLVVIALTFVLPSTGRRAAAA